VVGTNISACSCAYFLKILGYDVQLIDSTDRWRILDLAQSDLKLTGKIRQQEIDRLRQLGIWVSLGTPLDDNLISELRATCEIVYLSEAAPAAWVRRWEATDGVDSSGQVALDTSGRSPQTLRVLRVCDPGAAVVGIATDESDSAPEVSGKSAVLGISQGKLAAVAMDAHRRGLSVDCVGRSRLAGSGPISMEAYCRRRSSGGFDLSRRMVRLADINKAYHRHSRRIEPVSPDGLFSPKLAAQSAKRCFKCGTCTFCNVCGDFCPDVSITIDEKQRLRRLDYDHCKGCGICAQECPRSAIAWFKE
jgi:2-oxoacid:acceptor oxidoreductase delta subunit (pyruvate/2-ketoisovalerate family)